MSLSSLDKIEVQVIEPSPYPPEIVLTEEMTFEGARKIWPEHPFFTEKETA